MEKPWPFASVWELVKQFAKINAGNHLSEYPLHAVPSSPDHPRHEETPYARHKLVEVLWCCCFYVCEKYTNTPDEHLDQFLQDARLEELVSNLCYWLRPVWGPPMELSTQSVLTASLRAASTAVNLLVGTGVLSPSSGGVVSSGSTGIAKGNILLQLEVLKHLWDLRQQRRAEYSVTQLHPPFHACEGDDPWLHQPLGNLTDDDDLVVYRCYYRTYISEVESLLTSLTALLFQILGRFNQKKPMDEPTVEEANIAEFEICWRVLEVLKGLTSRTTATKEGWMVYELRNDISTGSRLERAYIAEELSSWDPNPWSKIERSVQPTASSSQGVHECGKESGSSNAVGVTPPAEEGPSTIPHPANPPPRPATWASLLGAASRAPSSAPSRPTTGTNAAQSDSAEPPNWEVPSPELEDLYHVRIRILLRAAAQKGGWRSGRGITFSDFVRSEMSPVSFGRTEKRKKLFVDYRSAVLDPNNNIMGHGGVAARRATAAQIKQAVDWRTAAGKHVFLRPLFRVIVGIEIDDFDEDNDLVIVA